MLVEQLRGKVKAAPGADGFSPALHVAARPAAQGGVEKHLGDLGFNMKVASSEAHLCCGSAGTYSVLNPEISYQLRDRKLGHLQDRNPAK